MSKKNSTNAVAEAEEKVTELTDSIADKEAARQVITAELRALRAALKAAESAVTTARAVALIDLADDPARFAEAAEKLRVSAVKSDADKADNRADSVPEFDGRDDGEPAYVGSGFGGDR